MLKLYGGSRSRASIVQWYLEELSIPYEFVMLDLQVGEHRQPEFLAINPMGKVPAIVDGDLALWESGAILLYLAEKYSNEPLTPEMRAKTAQWVLFANATLGPAVGNETLRERELPRLLTPLDQHFRDHAFLMTDALTVADVAVGSFLAYMPLMFQVSYAEYPAIAAYLQRLGERPAFQKAIGGRN